MKITGRAYFTGGADEMKIHKPLHHGCWHLFLWENGKKVCLFCEIVEPVSNKGVKNG